MGGASYVVTLCKHDAYQFRYDNPFLYAVLLEYFVSQNDYYIFLSMKKSRNPLISKEF